METLGSSFCPFTFLTPLNVAVGGRPRHVVSLIIHECLENKHAGLWGPRGCRRAEDLHVEIQRLQGGEGPACVKADYSFHLRELSALSRSQAKDQPALACQNVRDGHCNIIVT